MSRSSSLSWQVVSVAVWSVFIVDLVAGLFFGRDVFIGSSVIMLAVALLAHERAWGKL